MRTSIATVSISGGLDARLRAIADAGFCGAGISEDDLLSTPLSAREIARRVFFELIELRGYSGYGAINAPIRLAAQARHKPQFPD